MLNFILYSWKVNEISSRGTICFKRGKDKRDNSLTTPLRSTKIKCQIKRIFRDFAQRPLNKNI